MEQVYLLFPTFMLVFIRVAAFFMTVPLFSYRTVPTTHKLGFSFFVAWTMFLTIDAKPMEIGSTYIMIIFKEAAVGLMTGFMAYLILSAIQIAGGFIDFMMGFSMSNVVDPQTGAQTPITGQYFYMFALLLLLSVNGHHWILEGVFYSYKAVPLEQLTIPFSDLPTAKYIIGKFALMFATAFQMSAPVVCCLFLVDVALGIVARTVPQVNIFVVGMPVKVLVGMAFISLCLGSMFLVVQRLFSIMFDVMRGLMQLLGGT